MCTVAALLRGFLSACLGARQSLARACLSVLVHTDVPLGGNGVAEVEGIHGRSVVPVAGIVRQVAQAKSMPPSGYLKRSGGCCTPARGHGRAKSWWSPSSGRRGRSP